VLHVDSVSVRFGGVQALDDVTLDVERGSVTGLIGPNGAGKTTLFDVVNGLQRPNTGRIRLADRDITRLSTARRARRGLARTFQRLEVFGSMTARENIQVAAELHRRWASNAPDPREATTSILDLLGLAPVASVQADTLPTGMARLVELGRALATEPKVLLLDEPGSGLNTTETTALGEVLLALASTGIGVLLVEHDMELAMRVSDTLYVLEFGRIIATGAPAAIQADSAVRLAYLGAEAHALGHHATVLDEAVPDDSVLETTAAPSSDDGEESPTSVVTVDIAATEKEAAVPAPATSSGDRDDGDAAPPMLEFVEVKARYGEIEVLHGVDLQVKRGTVFALLGANGAGKSTALKVASGRLRPANGRVLFAGDDVTRWHPERLTRAGLCTIPEGRGVFPNLTVAENLQMWTFRGRLRRRDIEERAYARFPILGMRRKQVAGTLSGGEQQMLAIGRALIGNPSVLLMDEPSEGLAPVIVEELARAVKRLTKAGGLATVLVEQNSRLALDIAPRAVVMDRGRIVYDGPSETLRNDPAKLEQLIGVVKA